MGVTAIGQITFHKGLCFKHFFICRPQVWLSGDGDIAVDMNAHIKDPGIYAEQFGIVLSDSSPVDLSVAINTESNLPSGRFMLMTQNIGYDEWNVEKIGIDMSMLNGKLQTNRFEVRTDFALLTANIRANMTKSQMMEPTTIPFDAEIHDRRCFHCC